MKKDIDRLMKTMGISAIFAYGHASRDPIMYYLLNGANIFGYYVKKRGRPASVIHYSLEREVARKTGLRLINFKKYNWKKISERYPDPVKAHAYFIKIVLDDFNIKGTVAFYGNVSLGYAYNSLRYVKRFKKGITIYSGSKKSLLGAVLETKEKKEVERIRKAGRAVVQSFTTMIRTVRAMKVKKNVIMKDRAHKLKIGDLRSIINKNLFQRGYINSTGIIVAQGRDAAIPHNAGNDREIVKLGRTIVFDIYPQEIGGGYFFDFTRTICFGHASEKIKKVYRTVREAQDLVFSLLEVGKRNRVIETAVCKFFEKEGHPTFLSYPKTEIGYCHSLGHGLGLNVHEGPSFGLSKTNTNQIQKGQVFTVEPGLYYPDQGFGVRLEDVVYVNQRGKVENLTRCARNLVIQM